MRALVAVHGELLIGTGVVSRGSCWSDAGVSVEKTAQEGSVRTISAVTPVIVVAVPIAMAAAAIVPVAMVRIPAMFGFPGMT